MTSLTDLSFQVEEELKKRFLSPDGVLYDYSGPHGEVELPRPEECRIHFPNLFGWWTPIENGAFFTGDYLLGLLRNRRGAQSGERKKLIGTLLHGLFRLQDAARSEGCILRGLGSDGNCRYPASSCDQVIPWMLALYEFQRHPIATEQERSECRNRLLRLLTALRKRNWSIPGDVPGFERGSFLSGETAESAAVSCVNLLLATAMAADLSGEEADLQRHILAANEILPFGGTRLRILSAGLAVQPLWMGWFLTHTVYAMRLLTELSPLPGVRTAAREGMVRSGRHFLSALPEWKRYRRGLDFSPDWRICGELWQEHATCSEGEKIALRELPLWHAASPCIREEKNTIRHALSAAWIVLTSELPEGRKRVGEELEGLSGHLRLSKLCDVSFYLLENIRSELERSCRTSLSPDPEE